MKGSPLATAVIVILSLALPAALAADDTGAPGTPSAPEAPEQDDLLEIGGFDPEFPPENGPHLPGDALPAPPEQPPTSDSRLQCLKPVMMLGLPCGEQAPEAPTPDAAPDAPAAPQDAEDLLAGAAPAVPELPAPEQTPNKANGLLAALLNPMQKAAQQAGEAALVLAEEAVAGAVLVADQAQDYAEHRTAEVGMLVTQLLKPVTDLIDGVFSDSNDSSTTTTGYGTAAVGASAPVAPHAWIGFGLATVGGISLLVAGFAAARKFLAIGGAGFLSRIPSKDIMKSHTRSAIFSIIETDPGVSLNEIVDRLELSRNAVAYHLAVFESEKTVVSVKDGKYRRYFVNGGKYVNGAKDVVSTIKNDVTRNVIRFILGNPGAIQKEVCEAVGTTPSAANWHINRLEKVGLVAKEKVANTVRYSPGPSLQKYDLSEFGLGQPVAVAA